MRDSITLTPGQGNPAKLTLGGAPIRGLSVFNPTPFYLYFSERQDGSLGASVVFRCDPFTSMTAPVMDTPALWVVEGMIGQKVTGVSNSTVRTLGMPGIAASKAIDPPNPLESEFKPRVTVFDTEMPYSSVNHSARYPLVFLNAKAFAGALASWNFSTEVKAIYGGMIPVPANAKRKTLYILNSGGALTAAYVKLIGPSIGDYQRIQVDASGNAEKGVVIDLSNYAFSDFQLYVNGPAGSVSAELVLEV